MAEGGQGSAPIQQAPGLQDIAPKDTGAALNDPFPDRRQSDEWGKHNCFFVPFLLHLKPSRKLFFLGLIQSLSLATLPIKQILADMWETSQPC